MLTGPGSEGSPNTSIRCVILNSCYSLSQLDGPLGPATIGMSARLDDGAAIQFVRGFYDALAAGRELRRCFDEGVAAVRSAGDPEFSAVHFGLPEPGARRALDRPY